MMAVDNSYPPCPTCNQRNKIHLVTRLVGEASCADHGTYSAKRTQAYGVPTWVTHLLNPR